MRLTKTFGMAGALILSALIGGTLIGSALAQDEGTDGDTSTDAGAYCDTFMESFAAELGTTRDEVVAAGKAAANALGIEGADLIERLDDADTLEALAGEQGVAYDDVKAAILAAVQADLDAAVSEGLEQERADEVIERLTTWLDEGGQLGGFGPGPWGGRHHRGGFGPLPWF